jgi:hypothetical protein
MLTWGYAESKVKTFPKGQVVSVDYDPDHPEVLCLERGGLGSEDRLMLLVVIAGITHGTRELRKAIRWLAPNKSLHQTAAPSGGRC